MSEQHIAIYPGSFDPITLGHLNIIKRASHIFDRLIVCIMVNSEKHGLFPPEERAELVRRATERFPNVEVDCSHELLSEYARRKGERYLEENYEGSLPNFVAAFLKRKKLSKKEIDELAELIEEYGED